MSEDIKQSELQIQYHQKKTTSENFFTTLYTLSRVSCKGKYKINVYKNSIFNMKNVNERKHGEIIKENIKSIKQLSNLTVPNKTKK